MSFSAKNILQFKGNGNEAYFRYGKMLPAKFDFAYLSFYWFYIPSVDKQAPPMKIDTIISNLMGNSSDDLLSLFGMAEWGQKNMLATKNTFVYWLKISIIAGKITFIGLFVLLITFSDITYRKAKFWQQRQKQLNYVAAMLFFSLKKNTKLRRIAIQK